MGIARNLAALLDSSGDVVVGALDNAGGGDVSGCIKINATNVEPFTPTGLDSTAIGANCQATGENSFAAGGSAVASGKRAISVSYNGTASGEESFCGAKNGVASGSWAVSLGNSTQATANYSLASGTLSRALGMGAFTHGYYTDSAADFSFTFGRICTNATLGQLALGYNSAFGDQQQATDAGLVWKATKEGNTYQDGSVYTTGADYAEYFQTTDGLAINAGYFVSLSDGLGTVEVGNREIIGVVSATPVVVGDSAENSWQGKYLTDKFGVPEMSLQAILDIDGEDTGEVVQARTLNPSYDASTVYVPRSVRPEWVPVGLFGKLWVYYDGSVSVGDKLASNSDGKGIISDTGYRVLKVKQDDGIALILFK